MATFRDKYGPWAFVAGASEGLGAAWAREIASRGLHVVLAARRAELLEQVALEIRSRHAVKTRTLALDLSGANVAVRVADATRGLEVGLFVYNAASVTPGGFLDVGIDDHLRSLDVNCRSLVLLAHAFGGPMVERRRGGIVVMTSGAALAGSGYLASYHASKAFDLVLGESLWSEFSPRGVDVLSVIAGPTNTPHALSTGLDFAKLDGPVMEADDVVRESLDNLGDGPSWIPGETNREMLSQLQAAPRRAVVEAMTTTSKNLFDLGS